MKRKGILTLTLAAALLFTLAGCAGNYGSGNGNNNGKGGGSAAEVANPLVRYDTVQDAQDAMDVELKVPGTLPEGYAEDSIDVIDGTILQVIYINDADTLTFRTGQEQKTDLMMSGDYNEYAATGEINAGGIAVQLEGESDGAWKLANWTNEGMRYSLDSSIVMAGQAFEAIILSV